MLPHECLNNPEYDLLKNDCIFAYLLSVCLYHSVYADASGQTVGMSSLLLYGSQGSNSDLACLAVDSITRSAI